MPQITIDGQRIETSAGKTIIEAAQENGITIPHFCWHPALSVSGNCRMCLVNTGFPRKAPDGTFERDADGNNVIGWGPKLSIACATPVADGMVIDTQGDKTEHAQNAVMEFLLINHPLDCPICDEAGQCKLQEYEFLHSKGKSRFDEKKNHKDKRVPLGPNVMFDAERCISCSRCIRFADEVATQPVLTFVDRGDHVTIETFPGTQFDSPYSMNVIDICPVGALTSIDFRFTSRVWEMSFTDSICPGCSRGCNIKVGVRNNEILRLEPRTNMHVNTYWMCDDARLNQYKFVNENRLSGAMIRSGNTLVPATWEIAAEKAAKLLHSYKPSEIMILGSARATNEDNFLLSRLSHKILKTTHIDFLHHTDNDFADKLLRTSDRTANAHGAMEIGIKQHHGVSMDNLVEKIKNHSIKAVYVIDEHVADNPELANALSLVECLIVHASNPTSLTIMAHVLFATSTYAETEGTFTNMNKRVQYLMPAVATLDNERIAGLEMSRWDKFGARNDRWSQGVRRDCKPGWEIIQLIANHLGAGWHFSDAESVFKELSIDVKGFHGMSYELLQEYQGITLGTTDHSDVKAVVYESHIFKPN
ncbi:MAG: (2Fe-2S)-binding protein [Ignavibacteria bacterium]|nr:(2Fe-2S)-binding protein [Ignavibacteria bacterium]